VLDLIKVRAIMLVSFLRRMFERQSRCSRVKKRESKMADNTEALAAVRAKFAEAEAKIDEDFLAAVQAADAVHSQANVDAYNAQVAAHVANQEALQADLVAVNPDLAATSVDEAIAEEVIPPTPAAPIVAESPVGEVPATNSDGSPIVPVAPVVVPAPTEAPAAVLAQAVTDAQTALDTATAGGDAAAITEAQAVLDAATAAVNAPVSYGDGSTGGDSSAAPSA
jgi:hypothetical protein